MSEQFSPTVAQGSTQPVVIAPSQPTSVWRIAAATFVGIFLCQLITLVITGCFYFGVFALVLSNARR